MLNVNTLMSTKYTYKADVHFGLVFIGLHLYFQFGSSLDFFSSTMTFNDFEMLTSGYLRQVQLMSA